jgi:hypothetical protein
MPSDLLDDTAESAIRNYLLFLDDPRKLIDHELIEQLRNKAEQASDPIERLKVYAELERAQHADDSRYRLDFILHAKSWAEANNVSAAAFKQLDVKDDVLRSAGLLPDDGRRGRKTRKPEQASVRGSVSAETIKSHVRSLHGRFTLADVQSSVGGSPMTVRKGVHELVADGTITRVGAMPDWSGRGRAPIVFEAQ